MNRLYSNGPTKDFVINPFNKLLAASSRIYLAAPYFTIGRPLAEAANNGKLIQLLVGLNAATSPQALSEVHAFSNLSIRYLTRRFHAKIFIFDDVALIGSSNLTDGGLVANREAVACFDQPDDLPIVEEARALFLELWESAQVLTSEKLKSFKDSYVSVQRQQIDADALIESAVGKAEPINIHVESKIKSREQIFLEGLRRQVDEEYRPAFNEVTQVLEANGFRRPELASVGVANETNRFLNWVRLTFVKGDDAWRSAPVQPKEMRQATVLKLGKGWTETSDDKIPEDYVEWVGIVRQTFGTAESIANASTDELIKGLMSLHAFLEQQRFVKGGAKNLPQAFWEANNNDVMKVRRTLIYLIHGDGDFIQRLHDVLYNRIIKLSYFGIFCALELYGTVKPELCPPMNGRMAKALRYLGFEVRGA